MIDYGSRFLMICIVLIMLLSNGCNSSTPSKQNDNAKVSNQNDNADTSSSIPSNSPPITIPAPTKDDDFAAAIARFKKNVTPQLVSVKNARYLENIVGLSRDERSNTLMLLAEYDKSNREIFLSRIESIPMQSLDLWMAAFVEKSGEQQYQFITGNRLPHIEFLFTNNRYDTSIEDKYLQRVRSLTKNVVNDLSTVLAPFDERDSFPMSNALLVMISLEPLFDGANLKNDAVQRTLARLKQLQPELIASLAPSLKCENMKLFAANIAATDEFFVNEVFQEVLVAKFIKTK